MFQYWSMLPERLFARSAYGLPPLGKFPESSADQAMSVSGPNNKHRCLDYEYHDLDLERFRSLETLCTAFVEEVVLDSWYVPLVTAKPEILAAFERFSKLIVD